ncbi:NirA family protein [uncultured Tateyamaria sp.]|uniref:NirA family protein n=2 Tax=uncultured Tateyamaria sp. TaxID=455651 RepID=UPI00261627C9|nr:NirA family protein [uncultured Tateyamaria sp.]
MTKTTGRGFSDEQIACLMSALTKLELTAAPGGEAPTEHVYGTPLEDLCKEEIAKYKLHPLDMWDRLERWTARNEIATGLDQFLLRHLGFFNVEPASPGYMIRLRLPACQMRGDQMQAIADIADTYGPSHAHVTTRGNLQIREIAPRNVLKVMDALASAGLSCQGSGADSARNLTASPTAGFDPVELIDLSPQTRRLSNLILNKRELRALPRKFNISFDNGGSISAVSDSNDIAFQVVKIADGAPVAPGVYCRIGLGGISGHRDLTRETGMICTPDQTVMTGFAMLMVFVEHANRTNRKRARLKYLLDAKGMDWFIDATQTKLKEMEAGFQLLLVNAAHDLPRPAVNRQGHIGVHPQSDPALNYAGVALEMGRLSSDQMRALGRIASRHGRNDIRLTVWQNVLIPHIPTTQTEQIERELAEAGLSTNATAFAAGAVACTGKTACKLGLAHTKEDGIALVRHLEDRFTLDSPINIHLTGCPNSCAQHYIGDIGLVGATTADGTPGYQVVIGGGSDYDKGIGRPLCGPVPATELNSVIERIIATYLNCRDGTETFLSFVRAMPDTALSKLFQPSS